MEEMITMARGTTGWTPYIFFPPFALNQNQDELGSWKINIQINCSEPIRGQLMSDENQTWAMLLVQDRLKARFH